MSFGSGQNIELRLEAFNLFNNFNWGNPGTTSANPIATMVNFTAGNFGRITSIVGTPRIMQFGVKYGF